ncbi:BCS1 N terminal-domain-containing protein [Xylariaceae sp. FL0804]|nr:BCS1 N terminal-domain-containing protein [Xylariaceae sp. FL0804]
MANPLGSSVAGAPADPLQPSGTPPPYMLPVDYMFPGFSVFANVLQRYLHIDLNLYIPLLMVGGAMVVAWKYTSSYFWDQIEAYFMSVVDIRTDDEIYNILMAWVATQRFSQGARRFVVNTNLNSRSWFLWAWDEDDDDTDDSGGSSATEKKKKALSYTPSFGSHYFWYRGRLLLFRRTANRETNSFMLVSEREEISISCFGRNPWILKELLLEARQKYLEKDEQKTMIYRGVSGSSQGDPHWQRCMARATRPFSTVVLNEKTKQDLIEDVEDYLSPATVRWYANRGIPYRRGYLLHGPPGTGKSSLSLALAGFFKMRIYIVSLSSVNSSEEVLGSLFGDLPRRCVVLLEDIDTAGLTHTREEVDEDQSDSDSDSTEAGKSTKGKNKTKKNTNDEKNHRLSLSGLLNILDGVASQEGRVLIMTTNHVDKLDKALIRPGRVDMIVKFGLADHGMTASIFRAIFAYLEGDKEPKALEALSLDVDAREALAKENAKKRAEYDAKIEKLAEEFSTRVPAHEFSPAEIQGHLMKHKRNPQQAVATVDDFVEQTRQDHKEKQLKEAEEKRKAEEEEKRKKAEEKKKKAEEEEKKAEEEKKKKKTEEERKKASEAENSQDHARGREADKASEKVKRSDAGVKPPNAADSLAVTQPPQIEVSAASSAKPVTGKLETKAASETGGTRTDSGYVSPSSDEP